MKTLYIVRHAKASQDIAGIEDWQRPLKGSGIERAVAVSKILKKRGIQVDKIISSHALRALNTAMLFAVNLEYPVQKIEITRNIYEKPVESILNLIKGQNNSHSSIMLFGHNPHFTDLYNYLIGENILELSTSSVAGVVFDENDWKKVSKGSGKTLFIETGT